MTVEIYTTGLVLAYLFLVIFHMGQPALLYLVPCIIVPVLAAAFTNGELSFIWSGVALPEDKNREV